MKKKILEVAVKLYNLNGFSTVSNNQIAEHLKISAGNLSYHYKNKEVLINTLYDQMRTEANDFILPKGEFITLHHYEIMMRNFNDLQNRYAFFFREIVHILTNYQTIKVRYDQATKVRFIQGQKLINYYVETGRLKKESDLINYEQVIHTIFMTSSLWQTRSAIINTEDFQQANHTVLELLWNILIPYLTDKGVEEYKQIKQHVSY